MEIFIFFVFVAICRNERSKINGFWFYNKLDCDKIYELLEKIINDCHPKPDNVKNSAFPPQNGNGQTETNGEAPKAVDIFSMLSKAQHEFNNNNGGSNSLHGNPPQQQQQFAPMHVQARPQGPPPLVPQLPLQAKPRQNPNAAMPDITSPNVVKFFAAAQQPKMNDKVSPFPKQLPVHPNIHNVPDHIKPPVHTVDEIEKQHRLSTETPPTNGNKTIKYFYLLHLFIYNIS